MEALDMVGKEITTRCVIIKSGVPDVFCAGADLKVCGHSTLQYQAYQGGTQGPLCKPDAHACRSGRQ